MIPVVVYPDAQAAIIEYLADELPFYGYTTPIVVSRVPTTRPIEFVKVIRIGGQNHDIVCDDATLIVEAWAASEEDASDLIEVCRGIIHAAPGTLTDPVCSKVIEIAGPANLPDPDSNQERQTMTLQVTLRGSQLTPTSS